MRKLFITIGIVLQLPVYAAERADNVLFIVVTSSYMGSRYESAIEAITNQLTTTYKDAKAGLITVRHCKKDVAAPAQYVVPLGFNNAQRIRGTLKSIKLEGSHEDLVAAMRLAKEIVRERIQARESTEVILYAQTSCDCTATGEHAKILEEIKKMVEDEIKKMNVQSTNDKISDAEAQQMFNIDIINGNISDEVNLFFERLADITGGGVHNTDGTLDDEIEKLKEILEGRMRRRKEIPPAVKPEEKKEEKKQAPKKEEPKKKDKPKELPATTTPPPRPKTSPK